MHGGAFAPREWIMLDLVGVRMALHHLGLDTLNERGSGRARKKGKGPACGLSGGGSAGIQAPAPFTPQPTK